MEADGRAGQLVGEDIYEDIWDGTPLHRAMGQLRDVHDVEPLFYGGCCEDHGEVQGHESGPLGAEVGFVFWHDGSVHSAALTGWLRLDCRSYARTIRGDMVVAARTAKACRDAGMGVRRSATWVEAELDIDDREYFEDVYDDDLEAKLEEEREIAAERFREEALYRAFFEGIRRHRAAVEAFRRKRAARVIGDAALAWVCRPGGTATVGAKRSFEALIASGTR